MKLIDAHTHLNTGDLYPHREEYLSQFVQAGGVGLVNSGASEEYNTRGLEIAKSAKSWKLEAWSCVVKSTIGYHPECCNDGEITQENMQQKISDLKKMYEENKEHIVAIGECGIDTYYPGSEQHLALQKQLFVAQCDLARELWLPLMVHIRKDFESAFEILKNYTDLTVYVHCRWFGPEEFKALTAEFKSFYIWFCGNVTYKNAYALRDTLSLVALDHLLLETDAPWLSPQVVRGTMNYPSNVKYIYEFVADYLNIAPEVLSQQVETNFHSIYKI